MPSGIKDRVGLPSSVVLFQGRIEIAVNFVGHRISLNFTIMKIHL